MAFRDAPEDAPGNGRKEHDDAFFGLCLRRVLRALLAARGHAAARGPCGAAADRADIEPFARMRPTLKPLRGKSAQAANGLPAPRNRVP